LVTLLAGCQTAAENVTPTPEPTPPPASQETEQQTYENSEQGYKVAYPTGWEIDAEETSAVLITNTQDSSQQIGITVQKNRFPEAKTVTEWSKTAAWPYDNLEDYKTLTINGVEALEDPTIGRIVVVNNNKVYTIENGVGMERNVIKSNTFHDIVATFEFLE